MGDEAPKFTKHFESYDYSAKNYWDLDMQLAADIKCVNATSESPDPDEYVQATTLLLDFETHFDLNITYSVKLGFQLYKLNLKYTGDKDSVVDTKSAFVINQELNVAAPIIMGAINAIFDKGRSFSNIFYDTPLCWLNLDQIYLVPNYGDSFLWGGLTPGYNPERCPNHLPYGPQTELLLHPKELVAQLVKNILSNLKDVDMDHRLIE